MQFKVPQNIDMEDKIIGPLTLIQFVYLMIGGAMFYITLKTGNTALLIFVGIPIALVALFLAFIKIHDQPFSKFVVSLLSYIARPKQRVWHKELELEGIPYAETKEPKNRETKVQPQKMVEKSDLEKLSQILDTKGWSGLPKEDMPAGAKSQTATNKLKSN